jgi:hypothetical protein
MALTRNQLADITDALFNSLACRGFVKATRSGEEVELTRDLLYLLDWIGSRNLQNDPQDR